MFAEVSGVRPVGASASAICRQYVEAGVTHAVTVPDFVQMSVHERLDSGVDGIRTVYCCTEDQALTTAAGLHLGGATPLVMLQNQGLFKAMNTLRALCVDARIPLVLSIGQFGREPENDDRPMTESRRSMVRLLEPVLNAFEVPYWRLDSDHDAAQVVVAFAHARTHGGAAALIVGRDTGWM